MKKRIFGLLIEPFGIEILSIRHRHHPLPVLLIEPFGIEIHFPFAELNAVQHF